MKVKCAESADQPAHNVAQITRGMSSHVQAPLCTCIKGLLVSEQENLRKKSPSPSSRNVTGAGPLQTLGNLQLHNPAAALVTPETHKTRHDLFMEVKHFLQL